MLKKVLPWTYLKFRETFDLQLRKLAAFLYEVISILHFGVHGIKNSLWLINMNLVAAIQFIILRFWEHVLGCLEMLWLNISAL
jgi:hypothetical protein